MTELIRSITSAITSTVTYQSIYWLLASLWSDIVGRIFLVTIISYFIGFSVFGGYISRFSGGFGGLSLSKMGFQITDIVTLLPTMVFSILDIARKSLLSILLYTIRAVLYISTAFALGFGLGLLITTLGIQNLPLVIIQAGPLLYTYSLLLSSIAVNFSKGRFWSLLILWFLQIIGMTIITTAIGKGVQPAAARIPIVDDFLISILYPISYNLMTPLLVMALSLVPVILGSTMASLSVKDNLLSKVAKIALRQPIQSMANYEIAPHLSRQIKTSWFKNWILRSNLPITIEPDVYEYDFTNYLPVYLIFSFNDITGLYITTQKGSLTGGKLVVLSRDIIYSLEFYPAKS